MIEGLAVQRVVDKTHATALVHVLAHTRQPFPVAVMAQHTRRIAAFQKPLLVHLRVFHLKSAVQLLVAHAQQLDRLKEIVTKPTVELPLYPPYLIQ